MRDQGRSSVYAAEDQIARLLDHGGEVDFYGSKLQAPMQRRFGDLKAVTSYLNALRNMPWGHGDTPLPVVVSARSNIAARWTAPNTIQIPASSRWAMTEMVILHEYSHHVVYHVRLRAESESATRVADGTGVEPKAGHGREFRQVFLELVTNAIGAEAGLLLTAALDQAGVGAGDRARG
jgi:putative metallohydrolase (TIGR04338 family)